MKRITKLNEGSCVLPKEAILGAETSIRGQHQHVKKSSKLFDQISDSID